MKKERKGIFQTGHILLLGMVLGSVQLASASVISVTANLSTTVQELIDMVPGSVTSDGTQFNNDPNSLPLFATGSLLTTDLEGELVATGQGVAQLSDRDNSLMGNPEEVALEVSCYSNDSSVSYNVSSEVDETRTVMFSAPEITFDDNGNQTVQSMVTLSGAVIFWADDPAADLSNMSANLSVIVTREDTGATLFQTGLTVSGNAAANVSPSGTGPIQFEIISLAELAAEGVDADSIAVLSQVQQAGTLVIVAIPRQQHLYTYTVTADQALPLRAVFRTSVQNVSDGTGVTATLGRPFEDLSTFIAQAFPEVDGDLMEKAINRAVEKRSTVPVSQAGPTSGLCGLLGIEMIAMLTFGLCYRFIRRR